MIGSVSATAFKRASISEIQEVESTEIAQQDGIAANFTTREQ
ncbi:MAG: hypothetical protein WA634_04710 [Silvibacterium sp.]